MFLIDLFLVDIRVKVLQNQRKQSIRVREQTASLAAFILRF